MYATLAVYVSVLGENVSFNTVWSTDKLLNVLSLDCALLITTVYVLGVFHTLEDYVRKLD